MHTVSLWGQDTVRLRKFPSIPNSFQVFIMNGWWVLSSRFFASIGMLTFPYLVLLIWCMTHFQMLNQLCIPDVIPTRSWHVSLGCLYQALSGLGLPIHSGCCPWGRRNNPSVIGVGPPASSRAAALLKKPHPPRQAPILLGTSPGTSQRRPH